MSDATIQSTISMWGSGEYSLHTQGAKDVIDNATDLVNAAIDSIPMDAADTEPFYVADFAAADGGTSIDLMRETVGRIRSRCPTRPICICYTDLPSNDYSALFTLLHGQRSAAKSYLDEFEGIFTFASATSFFAQILPRAQLDFGFSATAMHWLSELPCTIGEHVHAVGATGDELTMLRARAAEDWQRILLQRAAELRIGGRLVMVNLGIDDEGRYMGNTGGVNMFDTMNILWRRLLASGRIRPAEYQRMAIPQFYRTLAEFRAPLTDPDSPVYQAGLRLDSAEMRYVPCPYAARFARDNDAEQFAQSYVPTTRTWSEAAFVNCLDADRAPEERHQIVAEFFASYVDLVRQDPTGHAMDYVHAYLVVSKI